MQENERDEKCLELANHPEDHNDDNDGHTDNEYCHDEGEEGRNRERNPGERSFLIEWKINIVVVLKYKYNFKCLNHVLENKNIN